MSLPELSYLALQHFRFGSRSLLSWMQKHNKPFRTTWGCLLERKTGMKKAWEEHGPNPSEMDFTVTWCRLMEGNVKSHVFMVFFWFMADLLLEKCWASLYKELITDIRKKNMELSKFFSYGWIKQDWKFCSSLLDFWKVLFWNLSFNCPLSVLLYE